MSFVVNGLRIALNRSMPGGGGGTIQWQDQHGIWNDVPIVDITPEARCPECAGTLQDTRNRPEPGDYYCILCKVAYTLSAGKMVPVSTPMYEKAVNADPKNFEHG